MEQEECVDGMEDESSPPGAGARTMPLNSRRVTEPVLRSLVTEVGLPTSASTADL